MEKMFYMTHGRDRDLIKYTDKPELKDAVPYTEEQAKAELMKHGYSGEYAVKFLNSVKEWNGVYQSWTIYKTKPGFN